MLELGEEIEELIGAEKKTETRKRTTYKRISRKLKGNGQSPKHCEVKR